MMTFLQVRRKLHKAERRTANIGKIQTQLGCVLCVFSEQTKKYEKFDSLDLQSWTPGVSPCNSYLFMQHPTSVVGDT